MNVRNEQVVVIGAGFTGLSAAYDLCKAGLKVTVLECENEVAGLAASFRVGLEKLERFYHHWFTNDIDVMQIVAELGLENRIEVNPTNTGLYYANNFFRLSTPMDLLKFEPLSVIDRVRLGLLTLRARGVRDWMALENLTAKEWLIKLGGLDVYRIVWEPLLTGKFGEYAEQISAVWFWNKLKLRGSSRGNGGEERLVYFKGGFGALAESLVDQIRKHGGTVQTGARVRSVAPKGTGWLVHSDVGDFDCRRVLATPALPLISDLIKEWADTDYVSKLNAIKYLANMCLVLELDRPLSSTYWLNVNDPSFPFVGVIEHTNFQRSGDYGGRHIVYLSKYLTHTSDLYGMDAEQFLGFAVPYLTKMFPSLDRDWITAYHLWKARWAQPIVVKGYSQLIPDWHGPKTNFYICSMAQVYPEDRGTNYAIRDGRRVAQMILREIG